MRGAGNKVWIELAYQIDFSRCRGGASFETALYCTVALSVAVGFRYYLYTIPLALARGGGRGSSICMECVSAI